MLVSCLYASRAAAKTDESILDDLLEQSRKKNLKLGITGLLCASDDVFVQILEGGRDEVCELYNSIAADKRHTHVRILSFEEISERRFGSWTMGQADLSRVNPGLLLKYFRHARLEPFDAPGKATLALMHDLVDTAAVKRGE